MFAIVVGGGKVGSYLANSLHEDGHRVVLMEKRQEVIEKVAREVQCEIFQGDACDPEVFEQSGAANADLVVAVTGHDEDNLVICQLAKFSFKVARVIARINNPRNEWLYTREWGVDVAVSAVHIIAKIIREEASLGDIVTLLKLRKGEVALVEVKLSKDSPVLNKAIKDISLPPDCVVVTIIRDTRLVIPAGTTTFLLGDEVLALTTVKNEAKLAEVLGAT
jgi:trk system potassium uptake protein TrkA